MMGRALLIIGWLATLGLVASGVLGYLVDGKTEAGNHLLVALLSALLLLFSHTWIMFYLIGTGKVVKTAVAEHGLDEAAVEKTKDFKNRSYPSLMLAMGLMMATFILGGGVDTGVVWKWVHHALFYVTLIVQVRALAIEQQVLLENERLMADVGQRAAEAAGG